MLRPLDLNPHSVASRRRHVLLEPLASSIHPDHLVWFVWQGSATPQWFCETFWKIIWLQCPFLMFGFFLIIIEFFLGLSGLHIIIILSIIIKINLARLFIIINSTCFSKWSIKATMAMEARMHNSRMSRSRPKNMLRNSSRKEKCRWP